MQPLSPPVLDLHGLPPVVLHRPRLAGWACLLFAVGAVVEMVTTALNFVLSTTPPETWGVLYSLCTVCVYVNIGLAVAGAIVLVVADVGRYALPRMSARPGRFILMLAVFRAVVVCIYSFCLPMFLYDGFDVDLLLYFCLSLVFVISGVTVGLYVAWFIHALQMAVLLRDRTFRIVAMAILCPVLLIASGQFFSTANSFANLHHVGWGLPLPEFPWMHNGWRILDMVVAVVMAVFFFMLAHRLRRAATNRVD